MFIKAYFGIHTFRGQASLKRGRHDHTTNRVPVQKAFFFRKVTLKDRLHIDASSRSAELEYLDGQYTDEIWAMIMTLPRKFREVLILDLYYEMSINQIAEFLNLAAGTVKSRLYRARKKVQNLLKENGDE